MHFRTESPRSYPARARSFLRAGRYFFLLTGILALGYVGFVLLDARLYQAYATWRFQQALKDKGPSIGNSKQLHPAPLASALTEANHARAASPGSLRRGSPLGRLEINRIGLTAMILEGTDGKTLRRAVGHVRGTPLPGEQGNVAIAGHRDTFFRALRNIREDDEITLTTLSGSYHYRVDAIQVVEPQDIEVLDDSGEAILTLVTCYPFYLVGPAPERFVVRAHRIPR
jgi:sortase A